MSKTKCQSVNFSYLADCNNNAVTHNNGMDLCRKHNAMILDWIEHHRQLRKKGGDEV